MAEPRLQLWASLCLAAELTIHLHEWYCPFTGRSHWDGGIHQSATPGLHQMYLPSLGTFIIAFSMVTISAWGLLTEVTLLQVIKLGRSIIEL
jgi:hypothetical protein